MSKIKEAYLNFEEKSSSEDEKMINYKEVFSSITQLLETLTFSDSVEIFDLLNEKKVEDILGMPFWFRSLAYKLLILNDPNNKKYIEDAINDLNIYGDEWEEEIEKYREKLF